MTDLNAQSITKEKWIKGGRNSNRKHWYQVRQISQSRANDQFEPKEIYEWRFPFKNFALVLSTAIRRKNGHWLYSFWGEGNFERSPRWNKIYIFC